MSLEKYLVGKPLPVELHLTINFRLLRSQKAQLVEKITATKDKKEKALFEGLIHLIDGIQDSACDENAGGLTEVHVFGKQKQ